MGEYAEFSGERIKIGTCEDMYYLRFDQRGLVRPVPGSVNVGLDRDAGELRFRFPWPDEDDALPGSFDRYDRAIPVDGLQPNPEADHGTIQFSARAGYLVSLPCPESADWKRTGLSFHRNGFQGAVLLCSQRFIGGKLWPVLRCGGCGYMWREMEPARIEELAVLIRAEGDRRRRIEHFSGPDASGSSGFYSVVADRLLAGAGL